MGSAVQYYQREVSSEASDCQALRISVRRLAAYLTRRLALLHRRL